MPGKVRNDGVIDPAAHEPDFDKSLQESGSSDEKRRVFGTRDVNKQPAKDKRLSKRDKESNNHEMKALSNLNP